MKNLFKTKVNSISIKSTYFIVGVIFAFMIAIGIYSVHAIGYSYISTGGVATGQPVSSTKIKEIINALNSVQIGCTVNSKAMTRSAAQPQVDTATVVCPAGYIATGGGLDSYPYTGWKGVNEFPANYTTWYCAAQHDGYYGTCYAICCKKYLRD